MANSMIGDDNYYYLNIIATVQALTRLNTFNFRNTGAGMFILHKLDMIPCVSVYLGLLLSVYYY